MQPSAKERMLDEMVRDFSSVVPRSKSEIRRRITTFADTVPEKVAEEMKTSTTTNDWDRVWADYCRKGEIPALHRISINDLVHRFVAHALEENTQRVREAVERMKVEIRKADEIEHVEQYFNHVGFNSALGAVLALLPDSEKKEV